MRPASGKAWLALCIASWFGCGYAPFAPGTVGSVAALLIALFGHHFLGLQGWHFGVAAVLILPVSIWAASIAAQYSGKKDPGLVVVDEVIGQWLTLAGALTLNWQSWLGALLFFRLFDIWKPPPVRALERLPDGTGIIADDAMAGVYGALVLLTAGCFNLY